MAVIEEPAARAIASALARPSFWMYSPCLVRFQLSRVHGLAGPPATLEPVAPVPDAWLKNQGAASRRVRDAHSRGVSGSTPFSPNTTSPLRIMIGCFLSFNV